MQLCLEHNSPIVGVIPSLCLVSIVTASHIFNQCNRYSATHLKRLNYSRKYDSSMSCQFEQCSISVDLVAVFRQTFLTKSKQVSGWCTLLELLLFEHDISYLFETCQTLRWGWLTALMSEPLMLQFLTVVVIFQFVLLNTAVFHRFLKVWDHSWPVLRFPQLS